MNMLRRKRIEEERGTNPHVEQIIAHFNKKPIPGEPLPLLRHLDTDIPPAFPGKEHPNRHTLKNYKQSEGYAESGEAVRFMEPTPQRARSDGIEKPYTKAPDYVDNYGKTQRPTKHNPVVPS